MDSESFTFDQMQNPDPNQPLTDSTTPIPRATLRAARASMERGCFFLQVGDNWKTLVGPSLPYERSPEASLQSWILPSLALGALLQFKQRLSDRQAQDASQERVEWKYALHLPMYSPGLSSAMLCKYRQQVYHLPQRQKEFQAVFEASKEWGFFQDAQETPADCLELLAAVCSFNRLQELVLSFKRALEALATHYPNWLRENIQPQWYANEQLFEPADGWPQSGSQSQALAEALGANIAELLGVIARSQQPELEELEEVIALRKVWNEQFEEASGRFLAKCSFCGTCK